MPESFLLWSLSSSLHEAQSWHVDEKKARIFKNLRPLLEPTLSGFPDLLYIYIYFLRLISSIFSLLSFIFTRKRGQSEREV